MSTPENPPAFPVSLMDAASTHPGMGLRDYVAIHAMAAIIGNQAQLQGAVSIAKLRKMNLYEVVADAAFDYADAFFAARKKGREE